MSARFQFPGIPSGWYAVAASAEVTAGAVVARRYFDRDLAVYRTGSGVVRVIDAFCPHMGAHLGHTGLVEGEFLRCGFHGLRFDTGGACVATPLGAPPPPAARLQFFEAREQNGWVLAWFDAAGRPPSWEVPALDDRGWNRPRVRHYAIATTPQETTENSVDFAHFTQLHGFEEGRITRPLAIDGAMLTSAYRVTRPLGVPGLRRIPLPIHYDVTAWGLGYSQVDVDIPALGLEVRIWVLPVPIDDSHIELRLAASTPGRGVLGLVTRRIAHHILCKEVDQDLDVWNYKTYLDSPALTKDDGPIAEYRRWARQFYTETRSLPRRRSGPPITR